MRDIKFRAWHIKDKEMLGHKDACLIPLFTPSFRYRDGETVLMQYTGLTDKNGVEIYEGDIVKWQAGFVSGNNAIIYNDGGFCIDSAFQDDMSIYQSYASNALEVIGNIHSNPELLEQKQ